jgi:hypothetical protein
MPETTESDRRRGPRNKADMPVTLVVDSDRNQIANSVFAIDLSQLGVRIRSDVELQPGQLVMVIPNEGTREAVPSRVVWIGSKGTDRAGEAGLAFLHPVRAGG